MQIITPPTCGGCCCLAAGTHKPGLVLQWSGADLPAYARKQHKLYELNHAAHSGVCCCFAAGTRKPGLVLQWSGADLPASARVQPQPVADLPGGWKTLPDMSWDAGEAPNTACGG
jgi:hypothetical protein